MIELYANRPKYRCHRCNPFHLGPWPEESLCREHQLDYDQARYYLLYSYVPTLVRQPMMLYGIYAE